MIEQGLRLKQYISALDTRLGKTAGYFGIHLLVNQIKYPKSKDPNDPRIKSLLVTPSKGKWTLFKQAQQYIEEGEIRIVDGNPSSRRESFEWFMGTVNAEMLIVSYDSLVRHIDEYMIS